ncbi:MAG: gamma-butyrobetaine hydroxylase-like domain-containing protein [Acidobacteriota bacterium]
MKPTSIKQAPDGIFTIAWDDGGLTHCTAKDLRDGCPCAECKGETILLHTYAPVEKPMQPGHYDITSMAPVGSYALQIIWGDGHANGLYSWDYLRRLTESTSHHNRNAAE